MTAVTVKRMSLFWDGDRRLLHDTVSHVVDALATSRPKSAAPNASSEDMAERIAKLELLPEQGVPLPKVLREIGGVVLAQGVRPDHSWCSGHLHSPPLLSAVAAELAVAATNQSMDSYDQAPAATLTEDHLVHEMAAAIGLPATASGVLTAGGTASNLLGLVLARQQAFPRVGDTGLPPEASRWRIVTSAAAHVSVRQAAAVMGLGREAVVPVRTDDDGRMDVDAMHTVLQNPDHRVIAIVGTAGTTDTGAIDPLVDLADAAAEHSCWFHVDAAVGGGLAVSDRLRPRLAGLERADSVTVDLHKLWWQPLTISALLVADEASWHGLREPADYLNRADDDGVLNLVDRSLDTSRRFDALKAVISLRATGRIALAGMVEHVVDLARAAGAFVDDRDDLELLCRPQSVMVLFRCRPPDLPVDQLDELNTAVQRHLFSSGTAVLGRTRYRGRVALKLTLVNPTATPDDVGRLLSQVAATAATMREGVMA